MPQHDVGLFATELSAKLAPRSRHVCVLLGAGASRACGLPDVSELQTKVLKSLGAQEKAAFQTQLAGGRNLEQALSRLRRIAVLLEGSRGKIDGLTAKKATALDHSACRHIVSALDVNRADAGPMLRLAAWAAQADYLLPLELFSVNYDLLLETALERLGVPYFDGFSGSLRARFRTELVEAEPNSPEGLPAFLVRLWKLHGSVHWAWEESEVVRRGSPVPDQHPAAIYPSDTKYDESRRVPFVVLQDRFRRSMQHRETLMLITGYSFTDQHLNEMIFDAAQRRPRSEFIALCHRDIPTVLREKATSTPNLQALGSKEAVIGGLCEGWSASADVPPDLWMDDAFGLGDFGRLASFLARSSPHRGELLGGSTEENV
ncbi:MAG TPA: SIR2 family protein [Solirubrobacteraceae bacterium]|nr:SIR2 family protein [Solirubrobacteraceae bacterium]